MKKHNLFKVMLLTMVIFFVFTWVFKYAEISPYTGEFESSGYQQLGVLVASEYINAAVSNFAGVIIYILFVGGFYGFLYKIPAYRSLLDKIVAKAKGKELLFVSVMMILLAGIVSVTGLQLVLILFYPFIISLILLMGYDKIVAALTVVGATSVGMAGSTIGLANFTPVISYLGLSFDYQIGVRAIILAVGLIILILNTVLYIKRSKSISGDKIKVEKTTVKKAEVKDEKVEVKVEKETKTTQTSKTTKGAKSGKGTSSKKSSTTKGKGKSTKSSSKSSKNANKAAVKDEDIIVVKESVVDSSDEELVPTIVDSNHKVWPIVVGMILILVFAIMAFIPWGEPGFKITTFVKFQEAVSEFEIFGFPIFAKILGQVKTFGDFSTGALAWTVVDFLFIIGLFACLLAIIYRVKFDDLLDGFVAGAKRAMGPAFIATLAYVCLCFTYFNGFQGYFYNELLTLVSGFNVATTTVVAFLSGLFNPEMLYAYVKTLPIVMNVITNADNYAIISIIIQSVYGLVMLIAPTSIILMATLSYLNINYLDWLKKIWKLFVEFLVVLLIIFMILVLI